MSGRPSVEANIGSGTIPPLNGADPIGASTAAAPETVLKALEIQPVGDFPGIADALADMSQPAPKPPIEHLLLKHNSVPPKAAFRVQPRQGAGLYLWMVSLPFGTAQEGEAFTHPIVGSLRESLIKECENLIPKRYEIRLIFDASQKYSLLEVAADPAHTKQGEENRQSLLRLLARAEEQWTLGSRAAGLWTATPSAFDFSIEWPTQTLAELAGRTYSGLLIRDLDNVIIRRYRKRKAG
jgi:hypothetical protein